MNSHLNMILSSPYFSSCMLILFSVLISVKFVFFLESLRYKVIAQEGRIKELEVAVKQLTEQKEKCDRHRKREGKFLESVINKCKGDNVPLTDRSCDDFCRRHKVMEDMISLVSLSLYFLFYSHLG